MKHPIQPLEKDADGVLRFKRNTIVRYLLDHGGISLNDLAELDFSQEDWEQFAQLIGYSVSGFGELNYVSEETVAAAKLRYELGFSEHEARNSHLRTLLDSVKEGLRQPIAELYGIHPDDLERGDK